MFAHELTHVIGLNRHPAQDAQVPDNDQDNLMWPLGGHHERAARISAPPSASGCGGDDSMETC
jgi:hypothetical protein